MGDKSADVYLLGFTDKFRRKPNVTFTQKFRARKQEQLTSCQKTGTVNLVSRDSAKMVLIDSAIEKVINGRN